MQTIKNLLLVAVIACTALSCKNETKPEVKTIESEVVLETAKADLDPNATYAKAEFTIEGMTCAVGCAKTIEKKLAKMEGVKSAKVDYDNKLAMVEFDNAKVTTTTLEETVKKVGDTYTVKEMKTVESFSAKKACTADCKMACCSGKDMKECTVKCSPDCTKKDCEKCAEKTAECKKKCEAKKANASLNNKTACAVDCKKACCSSDKAKA
ncbi:heavy-metal-associated domain-containing protein [Lacinutrix iliipiscaria]|uniref:Heavy-metal-associated domain-containing protein n=1 Tax=Lacinutrix iliipiscaria TaxID=1230532 RepID=A0ABW5WJW7_9FLAO